MKARWLVSWLSGMLAVAAAACDDNEKKSMDTPTDDTGDTSADTNTSAGTDTVDGTETEVAPDSETETGTESNGDSTDTEETGEETASDTVEEDLDRPAEEALADIRSRAAAMEENFLTFWVTYGPDTVYGGFHGTIDEDGAAISPDTKYLVQQCRHLWSFSTWYRHRGTRKDIPVIAADLYAFLMNFRDPSDGLFVYSVSRDGTTIEDESKELVGQAHAILAMSQYAMAFDDENAGASALALFTAIDALWHDALNGGYSETEATEKDTTAHMHLLEALTMLYQATGDATVKSRLEEIVDRFATRIAQPGHYLASALALDWQITDDTPRVSYGMDFEAFWMVLEALESLGRKGDPSIVGALQPVAEQTAQLGQDPSGGYSISGKPGEASKGTGRDWWVQAEALNGLLNLYTLTGDTIHLARMMRTLDFFETYHMDPTYGECFARVSGDNTVGDDRRKGYEWKASYHTLRFALYLQRWIDEYLHPEETDTEVPDAGNADSGDETADDAGDAAALPFSV